MWLKEVVRQDMVWDGESVGRVLIFFCPFPQLLQDPKDPTKCLYMGPCVSNPCQNGATCQNVGVDFKCKCNEGFRGKLCHILILPSAAVLSSEALIAILICILILLGNSYEWTRDWRVRSILFWFYFSRSQKLGFPFARQLIWENKKPFRFEVYEFSPYQVFLM